MSEAKPQQSEGGAIAPKGAQPAVDAPARLVPQLMMDRVKQREHNTAEFDITLHAGVEPDDILPVAYWSHLGETFMNALKQGEVDIVVSSEDRKWRGELVVVDAGSNWARVVFKTTEDGKRFITKLGGLQMHRIALLPGHTVVYSGVFSKWRVIRDADGKVLVDKRNTEGEAYAWLSDYAKSIQAR